MRNWNMVWSFLSSGSYLSFLSYLWGIETYKNISKKIKPLPGFYRTYEELKLSIPKKSQAISQGFYRTYEELKLSENSFFITSSPMFLSYLWGIETNISPPFSTGFSGRFYRTYEELKLGFCPILYAWTLRFYRTYEELKLKRRKECIRRLLPRFYRTYEELKLYILIL